MHFSRPEGIQNCSHLNAYILSSPIAITPHIYTQDVEDLSLCNIDLGFIVDESGSIGSTGFRQSIDFVESIVSNFTLGPDHTRVSLMTFSTNPFLHFGLNAPQSTNLDSFKAYLSTIPYRGMVLFLPNNFFNRYFLAIIRKIMRLIRESTITPLYHRPGEAPHQWKKRPKFCLQ